MEDPIISEDGYWVWNGTKWIPNTQAQPKSANQNIQDSVIDTDLNQQINSTNSIISGSMRTTGEIANISISDSVVTGDVNITVNQSNNLEFMQYVVDKLNSLTVDMSGLKSKIDSDKNRKKPLIKDSNDEIQNLVQHIVEEELRSGTHLLNSKIYDQLSTVTMASGNNYSTYFNSALTRTATTNEEWFVATKRRLKRIFWIYNLHVSRTPEAIQIMHDVVDDLLSGKGDLRIFDTGNFRSGHTLAKGGIMMKLNTSLTSKKRKNKYDLEADETPHLPKWEDMPQLLANYATKRVKLREMWNKYEDQNNRDWSMKVLFK